MFFAIIPPREGTGFPKSLQRPADAAAGLPSPLGRRKKRNRIGRNVRIDRGDRQPVLQRLCDQQPIERVAMERWQAGQV